VACPHDFNLPPRRWIDPEGLSTHLALHDNFGVHWPARRNPVGAFIIGFAGFASACADD
jgi:hypothetical protein